MTISAAALRHDFTVNAPWAERRICLVNKPLSPASLEQTIPFELAYDALVDDSGTHGLEELRSLQDWTLRYALQAVPGVAEVASIGGFVKQYQVLVRPERLVKYGLGIREVAEALEATNESIITHRLNDMLALLTILSAVLLPLTLITGFYGMNIDNLPFAHNGVASLIFLVVIMVTLAVGVLAYAAVRGVGVYEQFVAGAKEGVEVTVETGQAARITVQDFFLRYEFLAGMTGTAASSARARASSALGSVKAGRSKVTTAPVARAYDAYSERALPWLGRVIARDAESYRYLHESIRRFPPQRELAQRMGAAGFGNVAWRNMTMGVVALHSGWRL